MRRKTVKIYVGNVPVGGDSPISIQSMAKTDTRDVDATVAEIRRLEHAGCDIVRVAVPDMEAVEALERIKKEIRIPLIADIHFDWRLAIESIKRGIDGIRINPGNIGARWKIKEVVDAIKERNIPVRIGVNAGSLEKDLLEKYGHPTPEAIVESARRHIEILEDMDYRQIKVSLKSSSVLTTIEAYRLFSERFSYPLHIGISEAGPPPQGIVKSAVGLGILLSEGIGDTIRVSLSADPVLEVKVAREILRALGIRNEGVEIISCPTCGRCNIDIIELSQKVEESLKEIRSPISVAVMGCAVNGPGEAREADYGVAGGKDMGIIFKKGKVIKKVGRDEILDTLLRIIEEDICAQ